MNLEPYICSTLRGVALGVISWAAASIFVPDAMADLEWQSQRIELRSRLGEKSVRGEFHFTNAGAEAVKVESVQPGCDCIQTEADLRTYQPGEHGQIVATIDLSGLAGPQEKMVIVDIAGRKRPVLLKLFVDVPEALRMTPKTVLWTIGEPPAAKSIELIVHPDARLQITGVTSNNAKISVKLEAGGEGSGARVSVKPESTAAAMAATITIHTVPPQPEMQPFRAYAWIAAAVRNPDGPSDRTTGP